MRLGEVKSNVRFAASHNAEHNHASIFSDFGKGGQEIKRTVNEIRINGVQNDSD